MKRFALAVLAIIASSAAIAGIWNTTFSIIGGGSYCQTTVNGVCTSTIAAGPTALTGNETIPMDTGLSQGRSPQTVIARTRTLGIGPTTYAAPLTGASITITNSTRRLHLIPAGTIAALTVVFPAASTLTEADGQLFGLCTTEIVSTLTTTAGSGTTVSLAPTALLVPVVTGAASCVEWQYRLSNTTWYRTQ